VWASSVAASNVPLAHRSATSASAVVEIRSRIAFKRAGVSGRITIAFIVSWIGGSLNSSDPFGAPGTAEEKVFQSPSASRTSAKRPSAVMSPSSSTTGPASRMSAYAGNGSARVSSA